MFSVPFELQAYIKNNIKLKQLFYVLININIAVKKIIQKNV